MSISMKNIFVLFITVLMLVGSASVVFAASTGNTPSVTGNTPSVTGNPPSVTGNPPGSDASGGGNVGLENPLRANSIAELFQAIIDIVMIFAIPIIVFFIVYAGFMYVTARGNTEKIQTAHRALLYALIGALLIIGANVLIQVVGGTVHSVTGGNTNIIR